MEENSQKQANIGNSIIKEKNADIHTQDFVINSLKEKTIALIKTLRILEWTYGQIERKTQINRATFFRIENNEWYPKKEARQKEIFYKLLYIFKKSPLDKTLEEVTSFF